MSSFNEFVQKTAERERKNHYIVNIMLTALLSLVMIFCLAGGVKINVGSTVKGDGEEVIVRHNVYQLIDVVFSSMMSKEDAREYVRNTNRMLYEEYGVVAPLYDTSPLDSKTDTSPYYDELANLHNLIGNGEHQLSVKEASKINFLKYKFCYATAIGNATDIEHNTSWAGHMAVTLVGQAITMLVPILLLFFVSAVMLVHSIIALIKRKENKRAKSALSLLGMGAFIYVLCFLSFGFCSPDITGILTMILIPLCILAYILLAHAMMDKRDFSKTMLVHNGVILAGSLLAFILFTCPIFKVTSYDGGVMMRGWSYIFDVTLADGMYFSTPPAYFLMSLLIMLILMLPAVLFMIMSLVHISKFMSCNYGHNELKIRLILLLIVQLLIFMLIGGAASSGGLKVSSYVLGAQADLNAAYMVFVTLILGGLIAMEYLYKVKPVKRELILR